MSTQSTGRRALNRAARHDQLLTAASEIVASEGLDGLTMHAVAERVDCAVGTIYTYFSSKSALLAALQIAAIQTLMATYHASAELWEGEMEDAGVDDALASLIRLRAFGTLFVSGPQLHPREYELLQTLIATPLRTTAPEDLNAVLPAVLAMINDARMLIEGGVQAGVLTDNSDDDPISRTLRWAGAMNGALLISNAPDEASSILPHAPNGPGLALRITDDLLLGWGAPPLLLTEARRFVDDLAERDRLVALTIR